MTSGDVVAVFGAGPVGQLAALSARMQGAGRVLIVDGNPDRLETARLQNAETVNFNAEDPPSQDGQLQPPQVRPRPAQQDRVRPGRPDYRLDTAGIDPYRLAGEEAFDRRHPGWTKVTLELG